MFATLLKKINDAKLLPKISDTERHALEAGSVWVDGEFFSGNPDFRRIMAEAYPALPAEEQAFLDGPVEELLHKVTAGSCAKRAAFRTISGSFCVIRASSG